MIYFIDDHILEDSIKDLYCNAQDYLDVADFTIMTNVMLKDIDRYMSDSSLKNINDLKIKIINTLNQFIINRSLLYSIQFLFETYETSYLVIDTLLDLKNTYKIFQGYKNKRDLMFNIQSNFQIYIYKIYSNNEIYLTLYYNNKTLAENLLLYLRDISYCLEDDIIECINNIYRKRII